MKGRFQLLALAVLAFPFTGMEEEKQAIPAYKTLVTPKDADQRAVLERLKNLKLTPKGVKGQTLEETLRRLNQAGIADTGASGVMNFVIRGHTDDAPKVTLPETDSNFAAALDDACSQAGFRWAIEFAHDDKQPLLVLFHKDGNQSGRRGGGGDDALKEVDPSQPGDDPFGS